jgi:hypothetical protein
MAASHGSRLTQELRMLTFDELRLSSMLYMAQPGRAQGKHPGEPLLDSKLLQRMDTPRLTQLVAEMVIQADRIALANGIDLAQAVRERLAPAQANKETPHAVERK